MLEVMYEHPVSVIFFVAYLVIVFYYLMNVVSQQYSFNVIIVKLLTACKLGSNCYTADRLTINYIVTIVPIS